MATSMSSNKLVWLGVAALAAIVIVAVVNSDSEPAGNKTSGQSTEQAAGKSDTPKGKPKTVPTSEDGDTVAETIREVQARFVESEAKNEKLSKDMDEIKRQLNMMQSKGNSGTQTNVTDPRVNDVLNQFSSLQDTVQTLAKNVVQQKDEAAAENNGYEVTSYDLGYGDDGSGAGGSKKNKNAYAVGPQVMPGYVVVRPMTRTQLLTTDPKLAEKMLREKLGNGLAGAQSAAGAVTQQAGKSELTNTLKKSGGKALADVKPYYTIPARGTIFEAVAMTALIGTVPLGGKVNDPFPAKFIVGEENLATNGLRIPGLKGIVFEGIVRGNWNLSCAAVSLTKATYTFTDGRIQHMGYDQEQGGGGSKSGKSQSPFAEGEASASIGYVTNPQGIPCIPGKRVTDAHKQLFTMGMLGAAKSYFDAKAAAETTTTDNPLGGGSTSVTGDKSAFINNQTYADSMTTVMEFYDKRMRDSFDAIYVDPAAKVSLNITQDLYIDYHSDARKLAYSHGGNHVNRMD